MFTGAGESEATVSRLLFGSQRIEQSVSSQRIGESLPRIARCTGSLWVKQLKSVLSSVSSPVQDKEISMQGMISRVKRFLISEDGPTAVEYAIMLALIAVVAAAGATTLGNSLNTQFNTVAGTI